MREGSNTTTAKNPKPPSTLEILDATYPSSCSSLDVAIAAYPGWPGYANIGTSNLNAHVGNEYSDKRNNVWTCLALEARVLDYADSIVIASGGPEWDEATSTAASVTS
jgi:hypothetical protein